MQKLKVAAVVLTAGLATSTFYNYAFKSGRERLINSEVDRLGSYGACNDYRIEQTTAENVLVANGSDAVPALINGLGNWWNNDRRMNAINALSKIVSKNPDNVPLVVAALIGRLDDWNSGVQSTAAEALGRIGDPTAVPALMKALEDDGFWNGAQRNAARSLGWIASKYPEYDWGPVVHALIGKWGETWMRMEISGALNDIARGNPQYDIPPRMRSYYWSDKAERDKEDQASEK